MGCSLATGTHSKAVRLRGRSDLLCLTEQEKQLIRRTWKYMVEDMRGVGVKIFLRIFTLQPDVKTIFPCRDLVGEELLKDPHFKGHASRFMQAVGAAVDNLDSIDEVMAPLLLKLGEQHCNFVGFKVDYFEIFTEAIRQIWRQELKEKFKRDVEDAWMMVFIFIMTKLKEGYQGMPASRPSYGVHILNN